MTQHQHVPAASPAPDPVRNARLLAPRHQVIDEDPEPPPFSGSEVGHDAGKVVDAAEVLHNHPNVAQVIAPNLLHQLGVVAALDIDPAGQRVLARPAGPTTEPEAVRVGTDRGRGGALSTTGLPSDQNPAPRAKVRLVPCRSSKTTRPRSQRSTAPQNPDVASSSTSPTSSARSVLVGRPARCQPDASTSSEYLPVEVTPKA
jgi:hypothetical protein